jgi:hypothetical protein
MNKKQEFIDKHAPRYHTRSVVFEQDLTSLIGEEQRLFAEWCGEQHWEYFAGNKWSKYVYPGPSEKEYKTTAQLIEMYNGRGK